MLNYQYEYKSSLSFLIHGYVEEKRSVGYKFHKGASLLRNLDSILVENKFEGLNLSKEIVILWTSKKRNEKLSTRNGRISTVRGLAQYMVRLGYEAYIFPKATVSIDRYSYCPYIYSEFEINRIFEICDNYPKSINSPFRHIVLPLLFRVLYCCGLRISEALNLSYDDLNLEQQTLYIRKTKFNKERIIPMSKGLTNHFLEYLNKICYDDRTINQFIFPSPYGSNYKTSTIYSIFRNILWKAGISHTGRGPRLHDFRHTFSVHCLKKWVLKGEDLTNLLPYLSAYLGHCDLRGTQHYLRLTSELYPEITKTMEEYYSNIIPEVEFCETN